MRRPVEEYEQDLRGPEIEPVPYMLFWVFAGMAGASLAMAGLGLALRLIVAGAG